MALPLSAADAVGKRGHSVQNLVHTGHDIHSVDHDGTAAGGAQRYVENRPVFSAVDLVAIEHRVDPLPQSGFLRKLEKELKRLAGDAILRVIEIDADGFGREASATITVIREQVPQMQCARLLTVGLELSPGRPFREPSIRDWFRYCCHI
jgi:hypothetical protein